MRNATRGTWRHLRQRPWLCQQPRWIMGVALQILIDLNSEERLNFGYFRGFAVVWHLVAGYQLHLYKNKGAREKVRRQVRPTA